MRDAVAQRPSSGHDFLAGGGELGALMRSHDWAATPLGPPESWPQALKSAASICLGCAFPIAIYWGPQLALVYNAPWSPIPGAKHPWALGRPGGEVWPEIWDAIGPLFERVLSTGEGVWQEDQLLAMRRHGYVEECYFNFTFSPIRGEGGRVEGIFNAVVETTFRIIGERRTRVLRELADRTAGTRSAKDACLQAAAALGTAAADLPFCLIYLLDRDRASAHLAGASGLAPGHRAAPSRIEIADPAGPWPVARVLGSGRMALVEDLAARPDLDLPSGPWPEPVERALVMPIASARPGEPAGFLIAGISSRRALDEQYEAFLEQTAAHIAAAIANAQAYEAERARAEALAEIDRAKTAFFSNVSHEFRTPLTLMLGPLEDALAEAGSLPAAQRDRLDLAHRNSLRLLRLVNGLLDFSRIEAGRVQASFRPTDLAALTAELASSFRSATDKAGLVLRVDCPPLPRPVHVDRDMWETVVLNLLSNAFKFTFEGEIEIALREIQGAARLVVRDTGTGIAEDQLPRLFERFHRIEGTRGRSFEGSGIGLALVQELVRLHGGEIAVESAVGRGTAFTIDLPLGTAHLAPDRIEAGPDGTQTAVRAHAFVEEALRWLPGAPGHGAVIDALAEDGPFPGPAPGATRRERILLADDNADLRDYIARLLTERGYEVEAVADGEAALASLRGSRPDLLVSDVMMPRLDGLGLLGAVRHDPALRDLPTILLSARAGEDAKIEGLDAGADDYLTKPFSARELVARVAANLALARVRRETAEAIRATEARATRVLSGMGEGYVLLDRDFRIVEINDAGLQLDQRPRGDIVGKTHWDAWPGTEASDQGVLYRRAMVEQVPVALDLRHVWPDGHEAWIDMRAYPSGDGLAIFYRDISDRKRAESALRASEARLALSEESLRLSTDAAEVGTWDLDLTTDVLTWSDRTKAMFGIAPGTPCSMADFYAGLHPDDLPGTSAAFSSALDPGIRATYDVEYRTIGKEDGLVRWVAAKGKGLFEGARCVRAIGTAIDITRRKQVEARQRLSLSLADRARELAAPRAIVAAAVEMLGRHLGVSRVGYGEVRADDETVVYETDYADGVAHLIGTFPIGGFGRGNIAELRRGVTTTYSDVRADHRTSDADFAAIETRAAMAVPLIREGRLSAALYVNHREVRDWTIDEVALVQEVAARTWDALARARAEADLRELNATLELRVEERTAELLRAEEALRQAQKMEAVGQLTGGIAHDFNNMLAVVIGSLDLLGRRLGDGDPRARRYVDAATEGARRAALLTQRLLAFSRQQPLRPEPVDVNRLVAGMSDLIRGSLGGDIRFETVLAGGQWRIHADPNQLENVLLNLAVNARDAMPEGGRLTIETQNAHLDARYAALHPGVAAGQYVMIAVTDTGIGMLPDVIAKAFDPFFTTKEVGKGTGLGLSQAYGFVKQSGGHVKIYSEPGEGTTVKVYLPRLAGSDPELAADEGATDLPLGESQEVILVVEDEPAVRQVSVDALGELGYRVIEADGAAMALRLLAAHPEVALLFTDVVMPDVNGRKLADEARRRRPNLKILFTTGYTRNAVVHNGVLDPEVELVGKPFTIEELAAKVRKVLDAPA